MIELLIMMLNCGQQQITPLFVCGFCALTQKEFYVFAIFIRKPIMVSKVSFTLKILNCAGSGFQQYSYDFSLIFF
jgi:hypothetical protein